MSTTDDSDSSQSFDDENNSTDDENNSTIIVVEEQWVNLIEFCSCKSKSDESVSKNVGIEKLCEATDADFSEQNRTESGWILHNNNQIECFSVSFNKEVFINEIHVYESFNPGSIVKLEMLEIERNKWWSMWQRKSSPERRSMTHNIFKPTLRRYHLKTNIIRVTLDPRYTDRIGIQAIKLAGSNVFDTNFNHRSLSQSMAKLYDKALNNINTDVKFIFGDKIISAHRNILCCRSTYFRSLLLGDFLEKCQKKPLELTDIDHATFLEILRFTYTGAYSASISLDVAMSSMIYANKINFLTAKNAAIEEVCRCLRLNHDYVLAVYSIVKKISPTFDLLLDYIYELCSENMNEICKQNDFIQLEKEHMIDIICQGAQRRDAREQQKLEQMVQYSENARDQAEEE